MKGKRRKKTVSTVALGKGGLSFNKPGVSAGKVRVTESISLRKLAKGEKKGRSRGKRVLASEDFHPSRGSMISGGSPPLSKTLSDIASALPPMGGSLGGIIKGGAGGAALGALIGEGISARRRTRSPKKEKKKGTT